MTVDEYIRWYDGLSPDQQRLADEYISMDEGRPCPVCNGSGWVRRVDESMLCDECDGCGSDESPEGYARQRDDVRQSVDQAA